MLSRNNANSATAMKKSPDRTSPRLPPFQNEVVLQQALAFLLTRIPGITEVQILQGAQEYGKDIVFRSTGPLGELLYCACVVKNQRLTGKVGTRGSLRAVYDQIEQALDTPFVDGSGETRRIQHVYVMCPEEISPSAMGSVVGKLTARSGQVTFKCGTSLFEMFMHHWADFIADEKSLLTSYSVRLEEAGRSTTAMSVLALEHGLGPLPEMRKQLYVEPSFHREIKHYELDWPETSLLDADWLLRSWSKPRLSEVRSALQDAIKFFAHCASWPLWGWQAIHSECLQRIRINSSALLSTLEEALVESFREISGNRRATITQVHPESSIRLTGEWLERIRETFQTLKHDLKTVEELCGKQVAALRKYVPSSNEVSAPLDDAHFRSICAIDDCFGAYYGPLMFVEGRRIIPLGKEAHRKFAESLVIEGGPGSGKTSFCRWNALVDASKLVAEQENVLPIYVPLHELSAAADGTFDDMFLSQLGRSVMIPERLASRSDMARRLYLDGLDEVADAEQRSKLVRTAQAGATALVRCQLIITTRTYVREPVLSSALRITLSGLDADELKKLALLWLDNDSVAAETFMQQIPVNSNLRTVAGVPLLATVMLLVYKRTGRVPENRARLYSVFVHLLCGGWDLAKGIIRVSHFGVAHKLSVLNVVASQLHHERKKEFNELWFVAAAKRVAVRQNTTQLRALLAELLLDGIVSRTGTTYEFAHLSFQEFFTARELLGDPSGSSRQKALSAFLEGDQWWREVLMFYIGLSESPDAVARWLAQRRQHSAWDRVIDLFDALQEEFPQFDPSEIDTRPPLGKRKLRVDKNLSD